MRTCATMCSLLTVASLLAVSLFIAFVPTEILAQTDSELKREVKLPIRLTDEEKARLHEIGKFHSVTAAPATPVRKCAEWEPLTGVLVRYNNGFGLPYAVLREFAEDITLHVLCVSSQQSSCWNNLQNNGVNMANVDLIDISTNSIWTRDYGPQVVFSNGEWGMVDHIYNRPRPLDDLVPEKLGNLWGAPVYGTSLVHTGGNFMADGHGIGFSTDLVWDENSSKSHAAIAQEMEDYLGITNYVVVPDISSSGIHHIDCWAKLLDEETILVKEVSPSHSDYTELEENVAYLQTLTNCYGRPYKIVRVYCGSIGGGDVASYTNSLILNNKVFVPIFGISSDAAAIATYQAAMPGYEVLGFQGSWLDDDAIHCRGMEIHDRYMLIVDTNPLQDKQSNDGDYHVAAFVDDRSETGLVADSLMVFWRLEGSSSFHSIIMQGTGHPDSYYADIPQQADYTNVEYYVFAKDNSGRREHRPMVAPNTWYTFNTGESALPAACLVQPDFLDFGTVAIGDYVDATFTITNTGGGTLSGSVSESCDYYDITSGGGAYTLTGGQSVTVTVRFEPASASTHTCSIETGSGLCSDVSCTAEAYGVPPVAGFSGSPTSGEVPLTVQFTDQSTSNPATPSYSWDFGDGGTSTQKNPSHEYAVAGTYTVTLTVTNTYGSDTETKTDYITVTCTAPVADFSGSPTSGTEPLTVSFTDQSDGATSWSWDFGDGGTSTEQNPSHEYAQAGTYTVTLTATNKCGSDQETKVDYITVDPCVAPVANFSGSPTSGMEPLIVSFTDQSDGATSWSWEFGDGGTSTEQNPSHQYAQAGTYTVTLTATNACGSDQETKVDYITVDPCVVPVADFSGSPTSGDAPLTVDFADLSTNGPTSWSWDFGDGAGSSTVQNPSYTYTTAGTFTVSLAATNACGSDTEEKTAYITVSEPAGDYASLPYTAGFESGGLDQYWTTETTGDGRVQVLSYYSPHSGSYHMCMDDATRGGYSQTEAWLHVNLAGKSEVDMEFWWKEFGDETHNQDGVYFSDDGGASFTKVFDLRGSSYSNQTWNDFSLDVDELAAGAGLSLTGTFVIKFQQYDNYPMTSDGFAFDDISITEPVPQPPMAAFSGTPTSGSMPLAVQFTDESTEGPTAWSWDFGDNGKSAEQNPSHTYDNPGTYTVSLTVTNTVGSDTETKTDYITVTDPAENVMHVHSIVVTRSGWWRQRGEATVTIHDKNGDPVSSARVYVDYSGPNSGSLDGTTNNDGVVDFRTSKVRYPSGEWCFEVTNIIKSDWTYDPEANEVTKACESGSASVPLVSGGETTPQAFELFQNYPNPFNPTTEIRFALPVASRVVLEIFTVRGERVTVLANRSFEAGIHTVSWNASGLASGVYLYRLKTSGFVETKRMILLK